MKKITQEKDLKKLEAFLRGNAHNKFLVAAELGELLLEQLKNFCEKHEVSIEVCDPDGTKIALFTAAGTLLGIGAGFALAGVPGALVGGALGVFAGYSAAHIAITWEDTLGGVILTF